MANKQLDARPTSQLKSPGTSNRPGLSHYENKTLCFQPARLDDLDHDEQYGEGRLNHQRGVAA